MSVEIKVPSLGESITEAVVLEWLVQPGESVAVDQDVVALETDKITVNVPSPVSGALLSHDVALGDTVGVGSVVASVQAGEAAPVEAPAAPVETPAAPPVMPAARRLMAERGLAPEAVTGTGRGGRILKGDVVAHLAASGAPEAPAPAPAPVNARAEAPDGREELVPMSRLRQRIAERLVSAQQTAAMLTTFNEVDMSAVQALRRQHKEAFLARHGVKLGYTAFFAKATIEALKAFPAVNAEVRGEQIAYKNHFDIGVAVGGGRGLVVPVIRDADQLSFAEFEQRLSELAQRARDNQLALADLQGGTFTISNGGVYGSLMSTPILNPPQSGILGLHKIEDRPIAVDGQVVVRPMMYMALTYDHRIVDGREAVSFLVKVKEGIEDPSRLWLEL